MEKDLNYFLNRQIALSNKFNTICYRYLHGLSSSEELNSYFNYITAANEEITKYCSNNGIALLNSYIVDPSYIMRHCTSKSYADSIDYVESYKVDSTFDFDSEIKKIVPVETDDTSKKKDDVISEKKDADTIDKSDETDTSEEEKTASITETSDATSSKSAIEPAKDSDEKEKKKTDESLLTPEKEEKPEYVSAEDLAVPSKEATLDSSKDKTESGEEIFASLGIPVVDLDSADEKKDDIIDISSTSIDKSSDDSSKPLETTDSNYDEFIDSIHSSIDDILSTLDDKLGQFSYIESLGDPVKGFNRDYPLSDLKLTFINNNNSYNSYVLIQDIKKRIISDALMSESDFKKLEYSDKIMDIFEKVHSIFEHKTDSDYNKFISDSFKNLDSMTYDQFTEFCDEVKYDTSKLPQVEPINADDFKLQAVISAQNNFDEEIYFIIDSELKNKNIYFKRSGIGSDGAVHECGIETLMMLETKLNAAKLSGNADEIAKAQKAFDEYRNEFHIVIANILLSHSKASDFNHDEVIGFGNAIKMTMRLRKAINYLLSNEAFDDIRDKIDASKDGILYDEIIEYKNAAEAYLEKDKTEMAKETADNKIDKTDLPAKEEKAGKVSKIKNSKSIEYNECSEYVNSLIKMVEECTGTKFGTKEFDSNFYEIIKGDRSKFDADKVDEIIDTYNYINDFLADHNVSYNGVQITELNCLNATSSLTTVSFGLSESKDRCKKVAKSIAVKALLFATSIGASVALKSIPSAAAVATAAGAFVAEKGLNKVVEKKGLQNRTWSKIAITALNTIKRIGIYSVISKFSFPVIELIGAGSLATVVGTSLKLRNINSENETHYDTDKARVSEDGFITAITTNPKLYLNDKNKLSKMRIGALKLLVSSFASGAVKISGNIMDDKYAFANNYDAFRNR